MRLAGGLALALSLLCAEPLWARRGAGSVDGATPSVTSTPAVASGVAYFANWEGDVRAVSAQTGRLLWRTRVSTAPGPTGPLNDALLALRVQDGGIAWKRQFTRNDVWTRFGPPDGKDYDIGAAPNLFRIGQRSVVGVGDKAGRYATLDRETGRTVWRRRLCRGSATWAG